MHGELDRLLEDVWRGFDIAPFSGDLADFNPQVDIEETEDAYVVSAELPGLEEKDFDVSLDGDLLTLKGEKKVEREEKRKGFTHRETSSGSFHRAFRLPAEVDADAVKAVHANGVLTVTLPKREPSRNREIPVTSR
jgi:HSP20 family protein